MPCAPPEPAPLRRYGLALTGLWVLGAGCLAHGGSLELTDPGFTLDSERDEAPLEIRASDVELVVSGDPLEAESSEALRQHLADQLARRLGPPGATAVRGTTRLILSSWHTPLFATAPYKRLSLALETELPDGHTVRSPSRTVEFDDDELFALEHYGFAAAAGQGALALALAGLGVAFAGNDPALAANTVLFSAVPAASAAGITAFLAATLRGHAVAHERRRASDALLEAIRAHAVDVRADLERRAGAPREPIASSARGESAVTLVLRDDAECLSRVDLERDLEALVPASSSARFTLETTVTRGAREELTVRLRLSEAGATAPLLERELSVARADCQTVPRAIARIVRKHLEASAAPGEPPAGSAP